MWKKTGCSEAIGFGLLLALAPVAGAFAPATATDDGGLQAWVLAHARVDLRGVEPQVYHLQVPAGSGVQAVVRDGQVDLSAVPAVGPQPYHHGPAADCLMVGTYVAYPAAGLGNVDILGTCQYQIHTVDIDALVFATAGDRWAGVDALNYDPWSWLGWNGYYLMVCDLAGAGVEVDYVVHTRVLVTDVNCYVYQVGVPWSAYNDWDTFEYNYHTTIGMPSYALWLNA